LQTVNLFRTKSKEIDVIPIIKSEQLFNSIYYYNLAIGSKSIENSLSLLWTSIESCIPYRVAAADVENVQAILAKLLALGSFNRDLYYLITRLRNCKYENRDNLEISLPETILVPKTTKQYVKVYEWISKPDIKLFNEVKSVSELTSYEYDKVYNFIGKGDAKMLLDRIKRSQKSVELQIRRIYMHRNNIVHAGDFISEYTNLWSHTEYYAGKILGIQVQLESEDKDLETELKRIECDYDYVVSYLTKNPRTKIIDLPKRIIHILAEQIWQV
jgi:hypothetical protein